MFVEQRRIVVVEAEVFVRVVVLVVVKVGLLFARIVQVQEVKVAGVASSAFEAVEDAELEVLVMFAADLPLEFSEHGEERHYYRVVL